RRHLAGPDGILDVDVEHGVEVGPGRRLAAAALLLLLLEAAPEDLAEDVVCAAEGVASGRAGAELEARAPRTLTRIAETRERIAARSALEALEARLAFRVDLAPVEGRARLLVAQHLIGLVRLGEAVLGLRIVRVL